MPQTFTPQMLTSLRDAYATIETVAPESVGKFRALFAQCDDTGIRQLAQAGIKFVSLLAGNELRRRQAVSP